MKISIVNVQAPFIRGGAEYLADSLARKLEERGHRTDVVRIPFKWYPNQALLEHTIACRMMHIEAGDPDLVIALKFPAYYLPFPNKKVWLLHQFRQVYELWGTEYCGMGDTPESRAIRDMIHQADNTYLRETQGLFTNSKMVAGRLKRFNNIDADEVLYPPLDCPDKFRKGEYQPYFFYPSRLNTSKRQHVAIEAMRHVRSNLRLVIAGKADSDEYDRQLRQMVVQSGLEDRVQLLGWVSEDEKARWMSNALAAIYLPFDEDSYGYVTLEAFHSHKPLLTFSDSGGTNELVENNRNGIIVQPTAEALAAAMESMLRRRHATIAMGQEAFETLARQRINWDVVLDRLAA
jgi:glycosyltransferase involved in cell wall biosynthesis